MASYQESESDWEPNSDSKSTPGEPESDSESTPEDTKDDEIPVAEVRRGFASIEKKFKEVTSVKRKLDSFASTNSKIDAIHK